MARFRNPYPQLERSRNHDIKLWFWKRLQLLSKKQIDRLHKRNKRDRTSKSGSCHGVFLDGIRYFPIENSNNAYAVCASDRASCVEAGIRGTLRIEGKTYYVTEIGMFGFSNRPNLMEIHLPDTIRSIGRMAFSGCNKLEKVIIHGKQNIEFGKLCFEGCDFNKLKIERK